MLHLKHVSLQTKSLRDVLQETLDIHLLGLEHTLTTSVFVSMINDK